MRKIAIVEDIYIGDIFDAKNVLRAGKQSHIKSVLSLTFSRLPSFSMGIPRLILPIEDDGDKLKPHHFQMAVDFLRIAPRPVLVHCDAGMSRSPAIVAAYLVMAEGMLLDDAMAYARAEGIAIPLDMVEAIRRYLER